MNFRSILSNIQVSEPPKAEVIEHPNASLDALLRRYHQMENAITTRAATIGREALAYNTEVCDLENLQKQIVEKLKEAGIKAEMVCRHPKIDL